MAAGRKGMSNLDALWRYQEADQKVDGYDSQIRQFPMRRKLLALKKYYNDQQNAMRTVETNTDKTNKGIIGVRAQYELIKEKIDTSTANLNDDSFETATQVREAINNLSELIGRLGALERRLEKLMRDAGQLTVDLRGARANAAKAKAEYSSLMKEYDAVYKVQKQELDKLEAERDKIAPEIDAEVIRRYKTIKKRCKPPMAMLVGDQCGGCNMALPALIVSNARKGASIVECETCGRILYVRE
jgi:predicted  nucleic acid-binding Zn-ribbon protein